MRFVRGRSSLTLLTSLLVLALARCDCTEQVSDDDDDGGEGEGDAGGEGEGEGDGDCVVDADCADADPCTADRCTAGACAHPDALDGTPCGADFCTGNAACVSGACTEGVPPDLDADDDGTFTAQCFGTDCDDSDPNVFPGGNESGGAGSPLCSDGKDNDCDGAADALDSACGATEVCDDGWCWENPRPHGFALTAVWPSGPDDVWAGGTLGGAMHWDGEGFTVVEPFVQGFPAQFAKIWGSAPDDVWAAGGVMLHWNGVEWREDLATIGIASFVDVWGFAADDVWAAGFGRAVHYDGIAWTTFDLSAVGMAQVLAIHGIATDDMWAVGSNGTVGAATHWNGSSWSAAEPVTASQFSVLLGVFAPGPGEVWASGDAGLMWHRDAAGGAWTSHTGVPNRRLAGMFGTAPDDIWASGDAGSIAHWNGSTWGVAATIAGLPAFSGMRGRAADDIWTVGSGGVVVHYDGDAWSRVNVPARPVDANLTDVATFGGGDAVAVGADAAAGAAVVARRDDEGVWQREAQLFAGSTFQAVTVVDDDIWAVGTGPSWHYDGTTATWTPVPLPLANQPFSGLTDICAVGAGELYAVGSDPFEDAALVFRNNGSAWALEATFLGDTFQPPPITRVFCDGPGDAWAGGEGVIARRDPATGEWRRFGTQALTGGGSRLKTFVAGPGDVWVVSTSGVFTNDASTIARFDGLEWSALTVPELEDPGNNNAALFDVHGTSPDDIWFPGSGFVYHWNGSALERVPMPVAAGSTPPSLLQFVWAFAPNDVMFFADDARPYRWDGNVLTEVADSTVSGDVGTVFFNAPDDGWATSDTFGSTMHRWDGVAWTTDFQFPISRAQALWGFGADDVVAVGERMEGARWNGTDWVPFELAPSFSSDTLMDVWGSAPNDVWTVGTDGSLWHDTGAGFALLSQDTALDRRVVKGVASEVWLISTRQDSGDLFAVVERGDGSGAFAELRTLEHPALIQRVNGRLLAIDLFAGVWERDPATGWQVVLASEFDEDDPFGDSIRVSSAHFVDENDAWLVGFAGLRRYTGAAIVQTQFPFGFPAQRLGGSGSEVYGVGFAGTVVRRAQ